MNKTIYKYTLIVTDGRQVMQLPKSHVIVHVAEQGPSPCFWAMVDPDEETAEFTFQVTGTGHPLPDGTDEEDFGYIGAAMCGPFVWHVWQLLTS